MKIKPVGKILIVVILALVGFFGIKRYQSSHVPPAITVDSTVKHSNADSLSAISTTQGAKIDSPILNHSEIVVKKKPIPATHTKSVHKDSDGKKDKDGRKNLDLSNY